MRNGRFVTMWDYSQEHEYLPNGWKYELRNGRQVIVWTL